MEITGLYRHDLRIEVRGARYGVSPVAATSIRVIAEGKNTSRLFIAYVESTHSVESTLRYALAMWPYWVQCFKRERRHCLEVWLG